MSTDHVIHIKTPGPRPPFIRIAEYLWGTGCDVDSDGNSRTPDDREWTELSLVLRADVGQRIDIDPVSVEPLVLLVRSPQESLSMRVAEFIASYSGGALLGGV
jgi:hypothetical protein